jgi:hypothetical protein
MPKKSFIISMAAIIVLTVSATCAVEYNEIKNMDLSTAGLDQLTADVGAGFLKIRGVAGLDRIEVEAEFVIKKLSENKAKQFIKDKLIFTLEKKGSRAVLTAKQKPMRNIFGSVSYVINLTVRVPELLKMKIDDGSGSMTVDNIKTDVWVDDGSGSIVLTDIGGAVEIDDGSGDIELQNIGGDIELDDGSGTVEVTGSRGRVEIDDGSGSIRIRDVVGDVIISDGSGSISISGVENDVHIRDAGSGSVNISDVKGQVYKKKK